ncbi:MAG: dihydroxy-acid dehydratase [Treponema sp.]|jgi:dihydroxy-acid dehydratase|nr:dihydroxy-acid dehydratase [Treponema sp.]
MKYRSADILEGEGSGFYRSLFKAMGYTDHELDGRPLVGIANSWNTLVPGHVNLNRIAEFVKKGIYAGGGTAVEFGVPAACDGIAQGHRGMNYILPSREIICNAVEIMAEAHKLDALVMLASCDKSVPAMLMAAARLDLPAIIVHGGPMMGGIEFDGRKSDLTSIDEARGMYKSGGITRAELLSLENTACPGCGSCSFLGTANTMCCITEAVGLSLPGEALVPAVYAERMRYAFDSGLAVCRLAKEGIGARKILSREALRNGIKLAMAICGSTNAVLHLSAVVNEAELEMNVVEEFAALNKTVPQLVRVNPAAKWDMEAFHQAGGIPRVMLNLGDILDTSVITCTGKTAGENLASYVWQYPENREIIKKREAPFSSTGGIAVLHGNLAPNTAISKPGAIDPALHRFTGKARVFNSEEEAESAILGGGIKAGDVVVIRYEGPKGGPGMREMFKAMKYLYGMGLNKSTALITDGRFSGTNNGCFAGHISPEAAEGGPLAIVEDGDEIFIDVIDGILRLNVPEDEISRRRKNWPKPFKPVPRGYLRLYARAASSADRGAVIDFRMLNTATGFVE